MEGREEWKEEEGERKGRENSDRAIGGREERNGRKRRERGRGERIVIGQLEGEKRGLEGRVEGRGGREW
jgi:hypothetical protein